MPSPVIQISSLSRRFGEKNAVNQLDLLIQSMQITRNAISEAASQ